MGDHGRDACPSVELVQLVDQLVIPPGKGQFQQQILRFADAQLRQLVPLRKGGPPGHLSAQKHAGQSVSLLFGQFQHPAAQRNHSLSAPLQKPLRILPVPIEMRGQHHRIHALTPLHSEQLQTFLHGFCTVIDARQNVGVQVCHLLSPFGSSDVSAKYWGILLL